MKKLFTFLFLISSGAFLMAQEFVALIKNADTLTIQHAATNAVDINNDGNIDIIISGDGTNSTIGDGIFLNGGDKTFTLDANSNVILPGFLACIDHGDIDADGDIDFIFNGWLPGGSDPTNGIAINDGAGVFNLSTSLEIGTSAPSSGFADFNNDALLDYFFAGKELGTVAIYFQNADGTFTKDNSSFSNYSFVDPQISVIDFNNDGYLDMFINGWEQNQGGRFSKIFINDYFGGFSVAAQPNIIQKGYGSATWYDVDADGNLDLLLNGDGGADGEASSKVYRLYKNNNGILEEAATFMEYRQISVGGGARFADLDNDGDADIILTGFSTTENRQVTMVFECSDAANFTYVRHAWSDAIPGVSESDIEVADFNNDHKIDIVLSGFSGDFKRRIAGVVFNDMANANTLPTAPSNLIHSDISGGGVLFSWNAATDTETPAAALTYSLYLKDVTNGKWLINPEANMTTGKRKVTGLGNVDNSLSWPIYELPDGDYEWSVQAVDGAYEGSAFPTPVAFTILDGVIKTTTGLSLNKDINLEIYSVDGLLTVEFKDQLVNSRIIIYSLDGKRVLDKQVNSSVFSTNLKNGIYLLNISNDGKIYNSKLAIF